MKIAHHTHADVERAAADRERALGRLQVASLIHPDGEYLVRRIRSIGVREAERRAFIARVAYREARSALASAERRNTRWARAYHRVRR